MESRATEKVPAMKTPDCANVMLVDLAPTALLERARYRGLPSSLVMGTVTVMLEPGYANARMVSLVSTARLPFVLDITVKCAIWKEPA